MPILAPPLMTVDSILVGINGILCCSFFKECPHPDDKQRKDLGRRLGLEPLQVKFWFQNKRTQMKVITLRYICACVCVDSLDLFNPQYVWCVKMVRKWLVYDLSNRNRQIVF